MYPVEMDRLLTLAEIAIAMAGFSSIVVLFKRREGGTWLGADADRFNGMLVHSVAAVALCLLPAVIGVFTDDAARLWRIASALLGAQVLLHGGVVVIRVSTTGVVSSSAVGVGSLLVVGLQALNIAGVGFDAQSGPYLIGIVWHLAHAGLLFATLVFVKESAIER